MARSKSKKPAKTAEPKKKHPGGRPSKYKPEYGEMLIEHMRTGGSFETFGPTINVNTDTVYEWAKRHPEFSEAKKVGYYCSLKFHEQIAISAMLGKIKNFNATVWIFTMKNRFKWRDKIEHTGEDGGPIQVEASLKEKLQNVFEDEDLLEAANALNDAFQKKE